MLAERKQALTLFADKSTRRWVVLDADGNLWTVPSVDNAWEFRQPFQPTEETDLEAVPGHYKYGLGLPS